MQTEARAIFLRKRSREPRQPWRRNRAAAAPALRKHKQHQNRNFSARGGIQPAAEEEFTKKISPTHAIRRVS